MDAATIGSVAIAVIAAVASIAAQRQAAKASTTNAAATSRAAMETDAYIRARKYDMETIERQDEELEELRAENRTLKNDKMELEREARHLRRRVYRLENDRTDTDPEMRSV